MRAIYSVMLLALVLLGSARAAQAPVTPYSSKLYAAKFTDEVTYDSMGFRKLTLREQEIVLFQASLWFGPGAVVERKLAADFGSLRVFLEVTTPHSEDAIVGVQANSAFANLASANPNVRLVEKQEDADIGIQILILVDRKDVVVTGYVGSMVIVAPLKMRSVLGKTDHIDQFVGHAAVRASTIEAVVSPLYAQANVSQILPGIKYLQTMKESMEKSIPKN